MTRLLRCWLAFVVLVASLAAACAREESRSDPPARADEPRGPAAADPDLRLAYSAFAHRILDAGVPLTETATGHLAATRPAASGPALVARLDVRFPLSADEPVIFTLPAQPGVEPLEVRVTENGVRGSAEVVSRAVRFEREDGWSFWSADASGAEEWLLVRSGVAHAGVVVASWQVDGCVARKTGSHIDLVDVAGRVRAHVTAREAVTRSGRLVEPRLDANGDQIELRVDAGGEEVLVDPHWVPGGNLLEAREEHAAARLPDGRVLVVGGRDVYGLASAEIYDPVTRHWSPAGSLGAPAYDLTAVSLPDGRVLASGGWTAVGAPSAASSVFDPSTGTWSAVAPLSGARAGHAATALLDGRVLIGGGDGSANVDIFDPADDSMSPAAVGFDDGDDTLTTLLDGTVLRVGDSGAFRYDPVSDVWAPAAPLGPRSHHTATRLPDGSVLVIGGEEGVFVSLATAHRYDPVANAWTSAGSLSAARSKHTATLLPTGKVLVTGGGPNFGFTLEAELYDPTTNTWALADPMLRYHVGHTATLLDDGGVIVCGGVQYVVDVAAVGDVCELYATDLGDPCGSGADCVSGFCADGVCCDAPCDGACEVCALSTGAMSDGFCVLDGTPACKATIPLPRWQPVSVHPNAQLFGEVELLDDGRVFALGGVDGTPDTHLYDPQSNSWTAGPDAPVYEQLRTIRLADGRILVVSGTTTETAIFDPATDSWSLAGEMADNRQVLALALLADGRVIACGGYVGTSTSLVEIFDPATLTWSLAAPMLYERKDLTATTLDDGRVLVVGGSTPGGTATAEIYDVVTDAWTSVAPLPEVRLDHTATLMPDGRVLVVGGFWHDLVTHDATYFYDPVADTWTSAGRLSAPRAWHDAALLDDGRVMVAGGMNWVTGALTGVEIYDPTTNVWALADDLEQPRYTHSLVTLPSGAVLAVGGAASVERYGSLGLPCGVESCLPGEHCVDGVCCDSPCDAGACDACSVEAGATSDGFCQALTGTVCDDGASCTTADQCQVGVCEGTPLVCEPPNECHDATCEEGAGCASAPKPDGAPCSAGTCQGGVCTAGSSSATAGAGGSGAGGDDTGAPGSDADEEPEDGCDCRSTRNSDTGSTAWLLLALGLVCRRGRRWA